MPTKSKHEAMACAAGLVAALGFFGACSNEKNRPPANTAEARTTYVAPESRSIQTTPMGSPASSPPVAGPRSGELATRTDPNDPFIRDIALARCDRDMRCGNVAKDRKFETRDECIAKNENTYDDLRSDECKSGIDRAKLDRCLDSIRSEDCNSPLDSLQRLAACRTGALCMD